MSRARVVLILAALSAVAVIAGCSDNGVRPVPDSTSEQSTIAGTIAAAPDLLNDGLYDTETPANLAAALRGASPAGSTTPVEIEPYFFWRTIARRMPSFEFAFADTDTTGLPTTAIVTVRRHFTGTLNIVPRDPVNPDLPDTHNIVRKPLDDLWVRRFLMKRVRLAPGDHAAWKIAAATAVEVTSKDATTAITSIRVQSGPTDTTLTDPAAFIHLRRVLRFAPDDPVTLTVTTPRTDDVVLLYHHVERERFENHGDGTYTRTFTAGSLQGWRHFGVNALSHGTLYDDIAPYDSKAWIFPYVIVGGPDVDYLP